MNPSMAALPWRSSASSPRAWQRCFHAGAAGCRSGRKRRPISHGPRVRAPKARTRTHRERTAVSYEHILYEVADKIATITLNRPDRMNVWTPIMERDVRRAMESAAADDNVRVIIITGAGRAFCAGADMDALKGLDPNDIRRASSLPSFDMNRR